MLYLGDLDFSGGHIKANTHGVLEEIVGPLQWEVLALTAAQAEEYDLPIIQKYDGRDRKYHPAIETEALSQSVIVSIVRDRLEELIPNPLSSVLERAARESQVIRRQLQSN